MRTKIQQPVQTHLKLKPITFAPIIMKTKTIHKDKVNIITLGCSKNMVDSEVLSGQLRAELERAVAVCGEVKVMRGAVVCPQVDGAVMGASRDGGIDQGCE